jgi:hypothetical protein
MLAARRPPQPVPDLFNQNEIHLLYIRNISRDGDLRMIMMGLSLIEEKITFWK